MKATKKKPASKVRKDPLELEEERDRKELLDEFRREAPKHGIREPEKIVAAGNVICRGHRSPIYLIGNRFVLPSNHQTARELAMEEIGGKPCGCIKALRAFQSFARSKLPESFTTHLRDAKSKHFVRHYAAGGRRGVESTASGDFGHIQRKLRLLLRLKCDYEITKDPRCRIYVARTTGYPHVSGGRNYRDHPKICNVGAHFHVTSNWYKVILPFGLAVVEGKLILDVIDKDLNTGQRCTRYVSPEVKAIIGQFMRGERLSVPVLVVAEHTQSLSRKYHFDAYRKVYKINESFLSAQEASLIMNGNRPHLVIGAR